MSDQSMNYSIRWCLQGGPNFFEKMRTFSEEIHTIRTIFEKKSVQSVQFLKKIRTIRTFLLKKSVHLKKTRIISTIFEKNPCNPYIKEK